MPAPQRASARVLEAHAELLRLAWLDPDPAQVFAGLRGPGGQRLSVAHRGGDQVLALASSPDHGLGPDAPLVRDDGPPVGVASERLAAVAAALASALPGREPTPPALVDTGIKVVDVLAPLLAGGSAWLFGLHDVGRMKFLEELHLRLADTGVRLTLVFPIVPSYAATIPAHLAAQPSFPPDVDGGLRSVWVVSEAAGDPASARLEGLGGSRFVFSAALARRGCYPAIDLAATRVSELALSQLSAEHRELVARLRATAEAPAVAPQALSALERYFAQPFESARDFSGLAGTHVTRTDACKSCGDILAGRAPRSGYDLPSARGPEQ